MIVGLGCSDGMLGYYRYDMEVFFRLLDIWFCYVIREYCLLLISLFSCEFMAVLLKFLWEVGFGECCFDWRVF